VNSSAQKPAVFSEQVKQAIDRQRRILADTVLKIRVIGALVWLGLGLFFSALSEASSYREQVPYLLVYLALAVSVSFCYKKCSGIRVPSTLFLAVIDLPFSLWMQYELAIATGRHVRSFGVAMGLILIILLIAILTLRRTTIAAVTIAGIGSLAYLEAAIDFPAQFILTDSLLIMFAGGIGMMTVAYQHRLIHRIHFEEEARSRLARYFSPAVAAQIAQEGTESRRCHITVLFADIRGFTKLAETMDPGTLVTHLNEYFEAMVNIIFSHGGTLDKFMGDGILAYFGGHNEDENSAVSAVGCAMGMLNQLAELNTLRSSRGEPEFCVGIGIHSGPAVLGDVGSAERRDYTVIGDTVNLTARIEQLTKEQKTPILVSDETRLRSGEAFRWRSVAKVAVRGREQSVALYCPIEKEQSS
jgi:class 3 adenylate cyclase